MSKSWPMVKLGEVLRHSPRPVSVESDASYRQIGIRSHGKGVFHKEAVSGFDLGKKKVFWMGPGDFVINIVFGWEGAIAVLGDAESGMIASHRFPTFLADESRLDTRFLVHFFKTPAGLDLLGRVSPGGAGRNRTLSKTRFLEQSIPLPPLAEQRRIVARIEQLAEQIHEAQRLRKEAAEEAEDLFAKGLGRLMQSNANGWINITVEGVIESMDAGWSPQCEDTSADAGKWGVLKTTAVQWCDFQPQHNKALPSSLTPRPELGVQAGDVLVTRAGPRKRVGVVCAVRDDFPNLAISDKIIRLRPATSKVLPRFLELSLASSYSQEYLVQRKTGLADAQVNISQKILKATPLAYPPLPEQRRIVAELDALQAEVDGLKRLQAETSAELDALLPAILDRAFKGEL